METNTIDPSCLAGFNKADFNTVENLANSLSGVLGVGSSGFCLALMLILGSGEDAVVRSAIEKAFVSIDDALQYVGEKIKQDEKMLAFLEEYNLQIFDEQGRIKTLDEILNLLPEAKLKMKELSLNEHCTD